MSNLLEQASLVMIPSGYKEDVVYSEIPINGAGDLSFTRASNGTRINSQGLVEVVPWNLLPNSGVFALWNTVLIGGSTITVTDNFVTAPNGTLTGAKVVFSTFSDFAQLFQFYSLSPTQNLTATLYAKVPSGTRVCNFGFYDGAFKNQQKTLTTEWQRIEYTGSIDAGSIRACWFYGDGGESNVEVHLWGGQLNVGSTAKPYFPTTDRLNVPRLTYQNGGGGCPSLLLEKQSTNLVTYSEQFDNAAWLQANGGGTASVSVTANYGISPDGTQNADRIQVNKGNTGYAEIYQLFNTTVGTTYTQTMWLKSLSGTPKINFGYTGSTRGTITLTTEWQRYTFTYASGGNPNGVALTLFDGFDPTTAQSIDVLAWGAQAEESSYATSYIPSTSSSATRVIDDCRKTGISSLIGQSEGTLFIDLDLTAWDSNSFYFGIYGGGNEIYFRCNSTGEIAFVHYFGSTQALLSKSGLSLGRHKLAACYKNNDWAFYVDGILAGTDTSGSFSGTISQMVFGYTSISVYPPFQSVNQAVLFPTRLTNAELASLTTI